MHINPVNRWFWRKTLGLGWLPASREGWAVTLALVVFISLAARSL